MKISMTGKHMDLGEALQTHIQGRLESGISKYLDRINKVDAVISKEGHMFRAHIHANAGTHGHVTVKGSGESVDVYAAFDAAADKIEKQLRRYKRRLTSHHNADTSYAVAKDYVLAPETEEEVAEEAAPAVIAENPMNIETLSVSQAVMKMDLADLPALMFFNSSNKRINVVFRRPDGNISWVDPEEAKAKAA